MQRRYWHPSLCLQPHTHTQDAPSACECLPFSTQSNQLTSDLLPTCARWHKDIQDQEPLPASQLIAQLNRAYRASSAEKELLVPLLGLETP